MARSPREIRDEDIEALIDAVRLDPDTTFNAVYTVEMLGLICKSIRDLKGPMD